MTNAKIGIHIDLSQRAVTNDGQVIAGDINAPVCIKGEMLSDIIFKIANWERKEAKLLKKCKYATFKCKNIISRN